MGGDGGGGADGNQRRDAGRPSAAAQPETGPPLPPVQITQIS